MPHFGEKHADFSPARAEPSEKISGADKKIAVAITKIAVADEKMEGAGAKMEIGRAKSAGASPKIESAGAVIADLVAAKPRATTRHPAADARGRGSPFLRHLQPQRDQSPPNRRNLRSSPQRGDGL